jgi:hypothetical protein
LSTSYMDNASNAIAYNFCFCSLVYVTATHLFIQISTSYLSFLKN